MASVVGIKVAKKSMNVRNDMLEVAFVVVGFVTSFML